MRISKFAWIGAAVVLGSCLTASAFAQGQPPPGGRRGGFGQGRFGALGGVTLATVSPDLLAKELKLSDDQKTAIVDIQTKHRAAQREAFQPPADGGQVDRQAMMAKIQELNQKANKDIEAVLKDDQKADATSLVKNLGSLQTLRIPYQVYPDLKLTGDQKTKLAALAADATKERDARIAEMRAAQQAGDQAKLQEIAASFRQTGPNEKALAVLTDDQKTIVTTYIKDHPQQGGGGRRFGPGAGAGAGAGAAPPPQR